MFLAKKKIGPNSEKRHNKPQLKKDLFTSLEKTTPK